MSLKALILAQLAQGPMTFAALDKATGESPDFRTTLHIMVTRGELDDVILAGTFVYYMLPVHGQAEAALTLVRNLQVESSSTQDFVATAPALRLLAHVMRRLPRLVPRRKSTRLIHMANRYEVLCDRNLNGGAL